MNSEDAAAAGLICEEDRGALPYQLIHGEAMVAVAAWSLGEAGVDLVDHGTPWQIVVDSGRAVVLHDPLCPMTPPDFIAECVAVAAERESVVVAVRPVTDTVKELVEGQLGATVDRDLLLGVCSPIVLPPAIAADLAERPDTADFAALTARLRERYAVELRTAPAVARRVASAEDVRVLAALSGSAE